MSSTGERIAARMRELGLTQGDLARLMKEAAHGSLAHQTTIARIIANQRAVKLDEGFALADALGVSAAYLAGREEAAPSDAAIAKVALDRAIHQLTEVREGL